MRALLVVLATLACAGGDETMAAPRGILNSQERVLAHRVVVSPQQALYARPNFFRPATIDAPVGLALTGAFAADTPLFLSRIKGVIDRKSYKAVGIYVSYAGGAGVTQNFTVVVCTIETSPTGVRFKEITRGAYPWPAAVPIDGVIRVRLDNAVELDPANEYAIGVGLKTAAGPGAAFYAGFTTPGVLAYATQDAVVDDIWDGQSTNGSFTFGASSVSRAVPYAAMVEDPEDNNRDRIFSWY